MHATDPDARSALGAPPNRPTEDTPSTGGAPSSIPPSSGPTGGQGAAGFVMGTINSAIALVKNPVSFISSNKDAPATPRSIMIEYVAVLAAIPFVATLVGDLWYYSVFIPFGFAGSYVAFAFTSAVLSYILDVIGVYVVGMVIGMLAPTFGSAKDPLKSLKLSAYIFTPVFLIGVLDIIPFIAFLTILGVLYGLYILYLGLPLVLGTPKDKVLTYVIAVVVATIVVYIIIGAIVSAVTFAAFNASMGFL